MRVAVVTDIHANRHAFEAVLGDLDATGADEIWCLGDLVGYGAEPDACVALARERTTLCLAGNHDLAVTGALSIEEFSRGAALAARWTQGVIDREHVAFLAALPSAGSRAGIGLFHASPRDPVWEYVLSEGAAEGNLARAEHRVNLIGHSHVALAFGRPEGGEVTGRPRPAGSTEDVAGGAWLLNPGSVGQPRDGDPRAAWLELDVDALVATWHRVEYDVAGAQAAIRAAGLPDSLAERLGYGQ